MKNRPYRFAFFVLAAHLIVAPVANATVLLFNFSGVITAENNTGGTFQVNDPWSGSFSYDTATSDAAGGSSDFGDYNGAVKSFTFQSGSYSGSATDGLIQITDSPSIEDIFHLFVPAPASFPSVNGIPFLSSITDLMDGARTVFSSDALPTNLNLSDFTGAGDSIFSNVVWFDGASTSASINLGINTLQLVPEPSSSVPLLGLVALCLIGLSKRRAD